MLRQSKSLKRIFVLMTATLEVILIGMKIPINLLQTKLLNSP